MPLSRSRARVVAALVLAALLALTAMLAPAAQAAPRPVKVMTRNLYLGADLTPAIRASSPLGLAVAGTQIWNTVNATDFPARAKVLAKEIVDADPDLIGLQEAATWKTGPLGSGTSAGNLVYDYLASLRSELAALGASYTVVVDQPEADIAGPTTLGFDIRLTQHDVILAKTSKVDAGEITYTNAVGAHYPSSIQLVLPVLGGAQNGGIDVESTRGYTSADVVVNKRAFRFVNTHLEAFSAGRRAQQAQFLAQFGPASATDRKVVIVGDLNSDPNDPSASPPDPTSNSLAFNILTAFGYDDTWAIANPGDPGYTSGFNEFVNDADTSGLDHRIDHVRTRGGVTVVKSRVTGTDADNRTPAGLWPSDHAGVVASLQP
jgi:endonuclease/exonuclease/phosphatase family metal-dependent hydrolase